jgi:death on curing protein
MTSRAAKEPRWVSVLAVKSIHADQIESHGGLPGIRDQAGLEAALGRPRNKWGYAASTDLCALAAAYAFGLAQNHPFNDGNKRTSFLTMVAFLGLNGLEFKASEADVVTAFVALAAGTSTEAQLTAWIRKCVKKRRRS